MLFELVNTFGEEAAIHHTKLCEEAINDMERASQRMDMDPEFTKTFRASIVARARFIEDLVIEEVQRGLRQYVILGAGLDTFAASAIDVPLVRGCIGWLEGRVLRAPSLDAVAESYELVLVEVVAASADPRCWRDDRLVLDERQTLHHLGGGVFRASGELVDARTST